MCVVLRKSCYAIDDTDDMVVTWHDTDNGNAMHWVIKGGLRAHKDIKCLLLDNGSVSWNSWHLAVEGQCVFCIVVF